jgi:DMSO/TMAO reductase YedYZ molybdopterin-dependent catalytic subunit
MKLNARNVLPAVSSRDRPLDPRRRALLAVMGAGLVLPARAKPGDAVLEVKGLVEHPLSLSLGDLRAMPQRTLVDRRARDGAPAESTLGGVLLRDVLDRAKLVERKPKDLRKTLIIARARDDYLALFTWVELYLLSAGQGVLVVLDRDGSALPPSEGPLTLVSLRDERPGPRHLKWLESIEARIIEAT